MRCSLFKFNGPFGCRLLPWCSELYWHCQWNVYLFSSSTKRWAVLKYFLQPQSKVPKYLSDTRWEAHAKVTKAILESYSAITDALSHLYSDVNEKGDTDFKLTVFCRKWKNWNLYLCCIFGHVCYVSFTRSAKPLKNHNYYWVLVHVCTVHFRIL